MAQKISLDQQQILLQKRLEQLALSLNSQAQISFFKKFFSKIETPKSLYNHGDVGRGKSMLMKEFFESLKTKEKIYTHFNDFMKSIHEQLREVRTEKGKFSDELIEALNRVIKKARIICFDEFQVLDVADAMLLSRIFVKLFSQNIVVVFTSNTEPHKLYPNGLQREFFMEFVEKILLKNCEVFELDSPTDYRMKYAKSLTKRYFIDNKNSRQEIAEIIKHFSDEMQQEPCEIKVWGRAIKIEKSFVKNVKGKEIKIAVITFDELCRTEFAASDYQAIARNFDLIFLLDIAQLTSDDANEARRFILIIDEIYENKTALITLAKTSPEKIYLDGKGADAFKRTVSRLNEIQSDEYWNESKILKSS
jgi:cell division protein ZapE